MADVDLEQLSPSQQESLQQYMQVTNQDPADAIKILERSQWSVQIAIAKFFDGEEADPVAEAAAAAAAVPDIPRESARLENLQESLFASELQSSRTPRRARTDAAPRIVPQQPITQRPHWLIGLLLTPFSWGWSAASTLLRTLFYLISFLPAPLRPRAITQGITRGFKGTSGRRMLMPRDTAARFKREFDEEYGPNEVPFYEGGLAQAHDLAKKELKFLLVVLMSPEHDDTEYFVKETLLNTEVVSYFKDPANNIILWGGNVLDSEAYQVATEYSCTKFPFTAVVCLTPKEGSTRMGIVKRLVGPMPAETYLSEIQGAIERYGADLNGVRAERVAQEVARNLRTEQDSAYERSLAIDRERARQRKEAAAAAEAAERKALEEAEAAALLEQKRQQWKAWRSRRIAAEPPTSDKNVVRVALKMPEATGAGRITRRFAQTASMEELYAFVECHDVLSSEEAAGDEVDEPEDYEHEYRFRIASTLPREVYEPSPSVTIGQKIGKSGNLIVEDVRDDSDDETEDEDGSDEQLGGRR